MRGRGQVVLSEPGQTVNVIDGIMIRLAGVQAVVSERSD